MHSYWLDISILTLVLDSDLSFGIRLQPGNNLFFETFPQPLAQHVGVQMGERHKFLTFVGGVPDHESLVASAFSFGLKVVEFERLVNIRGLLVDVYNHSAVSE
jgi:hypothetical protein